VTGTSVILELARKHLVPTLLFASSSSVYAGNTPPFREDMKTDSPTSVYAVTKLSAEMLIRAYHSQYGMNCVILRYFSVYGPKGRPDMSYFRFIRNISEDRSIRIFGDGTQVRDFTFIDDIAQGTVNALDLIGCHTINLGGSDISHSINDLVTLIELKLGKRAHRISLGCDPSDLPVTSADISRARELLHWTPSFDFQKGMDTTIQWFAENDSFIRSLRRDES
jgi:nucleoside-diphosphate-sugar epimerase